MCRVQLSRKMRRRKAIYHGWRMISTAGWESMWMIYIDSKRVTWVRRAEENLVTLSWRILLHVIVVLLWLQTGRISLWIHRILCSLKVLMHRIGTVLGVSFGFLSCSFGNMFAICNVQMNLVTLEKVVWFKSGGTNVDREPYQQLVASIL
jgi:hypothetical protein